MVEDDEGFSCESCGWEPESSDDLDGAFQAGGEHDEVKWSCPECGHWNDY